MKKLMVIFLVGLLLFSSYDLNADTPMPGITITPEISKALQRISQIE